jgi:hypothetical protein
VLVLQAERPDQRDDFIAKWPVVVEREDVRTHTLILCILRKLAVHTHSTQLQYMLRTHSALYTKHTDALMHALLAAL